MDSLFVKVEESSLDTKVKTEPLDDGDSDTSEGHTPGGGLAGGTGREDDGVAGSSSHERSSHLMGLLPPVRRSSLGKEKKKETRSKKELEEEEREKMQVLVSNFTEDQLDHYEMFRRSVFPKGAIKRLMQTLTGTSISHNVVIAMSGIAKVFVGEVIEEALDVMDSYGESGPLQPKHLREAVRRLRGKSCVPNTKPKRPFIRL